MKGRKRHILVDTLGLIITVIIHSADMQDRDGAKLVFERTKQYFKKLKLIWADGGYAGKLIDWVNENCCWKLEIVKRSDNVKGFKSYAQKIMCKLAFQTGSNSGIVAFGYSRRMLSKISSSERLFRIPSTIFQIALHPFILKPR